jgi:RNA polymerase sigma-54 factor
MQLSFSQQMKMSQQMKLAPRMIQSMEILQLPIMALQERIAKELIENCVLEGPEADAETSDAPEAATAGPEIAEAPPVEPVERPVEQKELVVDSEHNNEEDFERLLNMPDDWQEDDYTYSPRVSSNRISEDGERVHDAISNLVARPQSLQEYLLEQFGFFSCPPEVREFAGFLIQNLDGNGRVPAHGDALTGSLEEMAQNFALNTGKSISPDDAQAALSMIQRLEPRGVGARDLKECFLLQIGPDAPHRDVLITLVTSHLEDLAENRLPVIERKTGYSLDVIKAARDELKNLNPFPGRDFEVAPAPNVVPDISVEQDASGKYVVRLEDEYTPRLNISRKYQQILANGQADQKTKEYIKRKIESARWLIESIEQRYNTLKRVAQAIVDHQTAFLDKGPEHIVPLKMQQIADVVGVHVTTVSRAVDDKYIQTPRGIFPLKRFFGGGTTTADGDEVAWDIIRIKLKEIVDKEDKNDPLSDDALVEALAKQGYKLARRTITKYRKALNIPSSRQRRAY